MSALQTRVADLIAKHGSVRAAARVVELDAGYLQRLGSGEKGNPTAEVLRRLGLRRVVSYEPIKGR